MCIASVYICTIFCKTVFIISYGEKKREERWYQPVDYSPRATQHVTGMLLILLYFTYIVPIVISQSTVYFLIIVSCNVISEIRYLTENICQLYWTLNASFLLSDVSISYLFIYLSTNCANITKTHFPSVNVPNKVS